MLERLTKLKNKEHFKRYIESKEEARRYGII